MKVFFTIALLFFCSAHYARDNQPVALKNYLKQCEQLLKNNGKWKTANKDYNAKDEWSASYFGYEFTRGINENTIHLKITGYIPGKSEWFGFWNGYYTWDYKKQKVVYYSVSNRGAVAAGESESITDSEMSLVFTITTPEKQIEKHRDVQTISNGSIVSNSFVHRKGKWEPGNSMIWTPLEQPTGKLVFMSTRDDNFEIYSMEANGDSVKNLSCNKATDYAFSATPDGRIVFSSGREGNREIYLMAKDMKTAVNLTNHPSDDRVAQVSPDGKRILFASYRDEKNGELYLMDIDGKNVKRLTSNNNFEDPGCWSPDGKKIYFARELKEKSDTGAALVSNMEIFVMDVDSQNEIRLTNKPGGDGGPMISPDGFKMAFYGKTQEGNYEIFIMNTDGSNIVNLSEDEMEDYSPSWSPDGQWIAYTKGNSKNYDVWIIHLETKIKYRLTTQPRRDESPFWLRTK